MNDVDLELMQGIPPEVLQKLMSLGGMPDQIDLERQRMAMGSQMGQPTSGPHTTAQGAALGGMGDILRGGVGGYLQSKGMMNQQQLMKDQSEARKQYATSIKDFLLKRAAANPPNAATPGAGQPNPGYGFGLDPLALSQF